MKQEYGSRTLRTAAAYMQNALKFYQLKNEALSRSLFVFILFVSFISFFLSSSEVNTTQNTIISLVVYVIVSLASSIYLYAYINDLKGKEYTFKSILHTILKQSVKLTAVSLAFVLSAYLLLYTMMIPGLSLLVIPLIAIYIMFIFVNCYIVDLREGLINSFLASKNLTRNIKIKIFKIFIAFIGIMLLPTFLLVSIAAGSENTLIVYFVLYFTTTVTNFMQQRLIALMYMDLEYGHITSPSPEQRIFFDMRNNPMQQDYKKEELQKDEERIKDEEHKKEEERQKQELSQEEHHKDEKQQDEPVDKESIKIEKEKPEKEKPEKDKPEKEKLEKDKPEKENKDDI